MTTTVPKSIQTAAVVVEQQQLAQETFRLRLHCPDIAAMITPGQFFMLRFPDGNDPLLGRPFALYDTYRDESGRPAGVDIGYHVIGKMTGLLPTLKAGTSLELWGPLGNGFAVADCEHLAVISGGIGYTPFVAVMHEALGTKDYGRNITRQTSKFDFYYGIRSRDYCANLSDLTHERSHHFISTDDGTLGYHGFVTNLFREQLAAGNVPEKVFCCGPEPMMAEVSRICAEHNLPCWLSLETPMACGFGACFSCVVKVKEGDGWDYRRTCVEGPVFPADQVLL